MNRLIIFIVVLAWINMQQSLAAVSALENAQALDKPLDELEVLDTTNRAITHHTLEIGKKKLDYTATVASITVKNKQEKSFGRIFYVAYSVKQKSKHPRPLTFVFNGGPGAASAYLHLGALGPKRALFNADGTIAPMPVRIVDNPKSWLAFTDLVFVDPIGTGYSREIRQEKSDRQDNNNYKNKHRLSSSRSNLSHTLAWGVKEDTDSLARFIRSYLTSDNRWLSPLFLAGESYGGFRIARLSKLLQSDFSIALNGLILISPVLDFGLIWGNERSLWPWVALLPSYAAIASIHARTDQIQYKLKDPRAALEKLEHIALSEYLVGLASGEFKPNLIEQISQATGLDTKTWLRWTGRVPPGHFAKMLLADKHRMVSLYDGSISLVDPEPAKQQFAGGDPYLDRLNAPLTGSFNSYIREYLNFETDLPYLLLNEEVYRSWNWRSGIQGRQGFAEAVTDLKQSMSFNPEMKTLIVHGVFDLVAPYYASEIVIKQMALDRLIRDNIQLKVYHGGHMPYLHQHTLSAMFDDAAYFYKTSVSPMQKRAGIIKAEEPASNLRN